MINIWSEIQGTTTDNDKVKAEWFIKELGESGHLGGLHIQNSMGISMGLEVLEVWPRGGDKKVCVP